MVLVVLITVVVGPSETRIPVPQKLSEHPLMFRSIELCGARSLNWCATVAAVWRSGTAPSNTGWAKSKQVLSEAHANPSASHCLGKHCIHSFTSDKSPRMDKFASCRYHMQPSVHVMFPADQVPVTASPFGPMVWSWSPATSTVMLGPQNASAVVPAK